MINELKGLYLKALPLTVGILLTLVAFVQLMRIDDEPGYVSFIILGLIGLPLIFFGVDKLSAEKKQNTQ